MKFFIVISAVILAAYCSPLEPTAEELEQNRNARYEFRTNVEDHISDMTQERFERREGLKVEGSYSYSDGFVKRTIEYVADENGYRILSETETPLDGPKIDPLGTASVDVSSHGNELRYAIKGVPLEETMKFE